MQGRSWCVSLKWKSKFSAAFDYVAFVVSVTAQNLYVTTTHLRKQREVKGEGRVCEEKERKNAVQFGS